ncbi:hypothetical protein [Salibacter halophilus]|uniref:Uncharacterized protein n=1 Tax=Salibacter halophilus TaxID=1803916 RepID=A0A6N6MD45_9FLAO|nr:hypothetical protein [Salibacter halophilus]KAB1065509.1 hypothetical protein F3059_02320 [Salibacter halophilus]
MSINNKLLPKLSLLFVIASAGIYGIVLTLHFITSFGNLEYIAGFPMLITLIGLTLYKSKVLHSYSSYPDYIEFTTGNLFTTDEFVLKRGSKRIVKDDIEEVAIKGSLFWKRLVISVRGTHRSHMFKIPLLIVSKKKSIQMIEDIVGAPMSEIWEANVETQERVVDGHEVGQIAFN